MMNAKKFKCIGFTILEILFTVSIIAVLGSIVTINVASRAKLAKDAAVKANLASLRGAVARYYMVSGKMPETLENLKGRELKNVQTAWEGANESGAIGYGREKGDVFLLGRDGSKAALKDYRGVFYAEY